MSTVYAFADPAAPGTPVLRDTVFGALEAAASSDGAASVGTTLLVCEQDGADVRVVEAIDATQPLRDVVAQVTEWTGTPIPTTGRGRMLVRAAAAAVGVVLEAHGAARRAATADLWLQRTLHVAA